MGLDYHTGGSKTASGGKMRTYTDDQSGGTDSGDAKQAWARGYGQALNVNDGDTFDEALRDLRNGKVVHLDTWHASLGKYGCVSGEGKYGHTVAVIPDYNSKGWLLGDPWCTKNYKRVPESTLRSAAETWGRKVLSTGGNDLPEPGTPEWRLLLAILGKRLMDRFYPGGPEDPEPPPPETSGPQPILFTVTRSQPLQEDDVKLISGAGMLRKLPAGTDVFAEVGGPKVSDISESASQKVVYRVVATSEDKKWWLIDGGGNDTQMYWVKAI